jgi:hypothetical protein
VLAGTVRSSKAPETAAEIPDLSASKSRRAGVRRAIVWKKNKTLCADSDNAICCREAVDRARREVETPIWTRNRARSWSANVLAAESRKLRALQANVEARDARIEAGRESMEAGVRQLQGFIRTIAVVLPPIPVLIVGALVFLRRRSDERRGAAAAGRAGSAP